MISTIHQKLVTEHKLGLSALSTAFTAHNSFSTMHRNKVLQHTTVSALCAKAIFTAFQCLEQSQALAAYNSFCFMHQNKLLQHTTVSVLCTKIKLLQHTSVTFLNSERFLTYCSCPTVRDWIAVHPALFSLTWIFSRRHANL